MHLNKECRYPDLSNLFERTDVTEAVQPLLGKVGWEIDAQLAMLDGPLPDVPIGLQCHEPYKCPFMERCWPKDPDHIMRLFNIARLLFVAQKIAPEERDRVRQDLLNYCERYLGNG